MKPIDVVNRAFRKAFPNGTPEADLGYDELLALFTAWRMELAAKGDSAQRVAARLQHLITYYAGARLSQANREIAIRAGAEAFGYRVEFTARGDVKQLERLTVQ